MSRLKERHGAIKFAIIESAIYTFKSKDIKEVKKWREEKERD